MMIIKKTIAIAITLNLFSCSSTFIKGNYNDVRVKIDSSRKLDTNGYKADSLVGIKLSKNPPKQWKK